MHSHLRFVFPDIAREIPISKPSKTYKPDFGIRSLRAAVEYKFVDSEKEARKTLGEVYEDIHGYSGSLDWTEVYFVMYQTGNYVTKHVIDAEWELQTPTSDGIRSSISRRATRSPGRRSPVTPPPVRGGQPGRHQARR